MTTIRLCRRPGPRLFFLPVSLTIVSFAAFLAMPGAVRAQRGDRTAPRQGTTVPPAPGETQPPANSDEEFEQLRAPTLLSPQDLLRQTVTEEPTEEPEEPEPTEPTEPATTTSTPAETAPVTSSVSQSSDPTRDTWRHVDTMVSLHGYLRMRTEILQDNFHLGRMRGGIGGMNADPDVFLNWVQDEARDTSMVSPDCERNPRCGGGAFSYATMRVRLMPQIDVTDDIRVKMWIDAFDNIVLGSTPDTRLFLPDGTSSRSAFSGLGVSPVTQLPPSPYRNNLESSLIARRAWAEVRNRSLGELRFGRMGFHWGLGMTWNAGDDIDGDYSTDVDRIMGITKIQGLYVMAAWDFASTGFGQFPTARPTGMSGSTPSVDPAVMVDRSTRDNTMQLMFSVARRSSPEEQAAALARDEFVLNAGALFAYRKQDLSLAETARGFTGPSAELLFMRRNSELFMPNLWVQFLWRKLRVEGEFAMQFGSLESASRGASIGGGAAEAWRPQNYQILQFGMAAEAELQPFEDPPVNIHFGFGYASGDADAEGLSAFDDNVTQLGTNGDRTVSTFRFHPNYRVDLILWRNVLRQIQGAYYFRPGISWDILKGSDGQLLRLRGDFVYSRAVAGLQTWGNAQDLGIELDAALTYRRGEGPNFLDGFYATAQFGVLFPQQGLGYLSDGANTERTDGPGGRNPGLQTAITLRALLGVQF